MKGAVPIHNVVVPVFPSQGKDVRAVVLKSLKQIALGIQVAIRPIFNGNEFPI